METLTAKELQEMGVDLDNFRPDALSDYVECLSDLENITLFDPSQGALERAVNALSHMAAYEPDLPVGIMSLETTDIADDTPAGDTTEDGSDGAGAEDGAEDGENAGISRHFTCASVLWDESVRFDFLFPVDLGVRETSWVTASSFSDLVYKMLFSPQELGQGASAAKADEPDWANGGFTPIFLNTREDDPTVRLSNSLAQQLGVAMSSHHDLYSHDLNDDEQAVLRHSAKAVVNGLDIRLNQLLAVGHFQPFASEEAIVFCQSKQAGGIFIGSNCVVGPFRR